MPLYEYNCRACSRRFEALVLGRSRPACPACGGEDLEKLFSTFAVGGGSSSAGAGTIENSGSCGSCGDPRGPGSCAVH